jgi:hypothetical protein
LGAAQPTIQDETMKARALRVVKRYSLWLGMTTASLSGSFAILPIGIDRLLLPERAAVPAVRECKARQVVEPQRITRWQEQKEPRGLMRWLFDA